MKKLFPVFLALAFLGYCFIAQAAEEKEKKEATPPKTQIDCANKFKTEGVCPQEMCFLSCGSGSTRDKCLQECLPLDCVQISADECPVDRCVKLKGCDGKEVCYEKMDSEPVSCGGLAYPWQDVECCEGLVKRCGIEFFDGTCDMVGKNSVYNVPVCLPCGNGICNQFENRCNCPEDCK